MAMIFASTRERLVLRDIGAGYRSLKGRASHDDARGATTH
jgi:hypothetical protein